MPKTRLLETFAPSIEGAAASVREWVCPGPGARGAAASF